MVGYAVNGSLITPIIMKFQFMKHVVVRPGRVTTDSLVASCGLIQFLKAPRSVFRRQPCFEFIAMLHCVHMVRVSVI